MTRVDEIIMDQLSRPTRNTISFSASLWAPYWIREGGVGWGGVGGTAPSAIYQYGHSHLYTDMIVACNNSTQFVLPTPSVTTVRA